MGIKTDTTMKRHIVILDKVCRSAIYGIGSYLEQIKICFSQFDNTFIHIIWLNSEVSVCEIKSDREFLEEIMLPSYDQVPSCHIARYYRSCWYLLRSFLQIEKEAPVYFFLNHTKYYLLVPEIKQTFPQSIVYFTIHYQKWCFLLDGQVAALRSLLSKQEQELQGMERDIWHSFQEEQSAYRSVDRVVSLSRFTSGLLQQVYQIPAHKIDLVYNGMADVAPVGPRDKESLKKELGFPSGERIILFVGRLDPVKGVHLLLRAFMALSEELPDCRLILAGDGNLLPYLQACDRHWGRITFTGRLGKERLYQLYQMADIGVMPSLHEQCSYTAIEMMMFGIPLIASTTTGLKEMIRENVNGLLFEMRDEADEGATRQLQILMKELLTDPQRLAGLQQGARSVYEEVYSLEKMADAYARLIGLDKKNP